MPSFSPIWLYSICISLQDMVETFLQGRLLGTAPLGKAGRKHMYLKRLGMRGFKSFVDAQVSFQPGITAVVGPNGTSKSNILDAVLWVLGEQSTTALRSERMEDVIFNGTESRQPLGMAEVSLILGDVDGRPHDNGNGNGSGEAAALPFALGECHEVMVTRRLFRDGVSEYFINKTSCRLKDIRSLLLDTRAGSKGHTVIEQGRIDRVLKASPVERRELIEETAGIIRYKRQKAEALRKLEATHQNLLRVRDIIHEVRRQLAALERQARAAKQFQALRQEVRRLEITLLVHDYRAVLHEREEADRVLGELALRESAEAAAAARLASEVETHQLGVAEGCGPSATTGPRSMRRARPSGIGRSPPPIRIIGWLAIGLARRNSAGGSSAWNRSGSKPFRSWSWPRPCSRPVSSGAASSKCNWRRPEALEGVLLRKSCGSGISTTRLRNGWLVCRKKKRWRSPVRRSCRRWGTMWSEGGLALQPT